ncbi:MAG: hypothetical protein HY754_14215 [Nitrospirae bacterium]|nr:hypothetical protein [Nitrospirota bacterium]
MATTIPIKVYEILEDKLGKEQARELVSEIEKTADAIAKEKTLEIKDDLRKELVTRDIFETRMSLLEAKFETRISLLESKLEYKMRLYFLILLFVIIILNPRAIDLIAKLLGIIK